MRAESAAARECNVKWRDRGPIGATGEVWRGQEWRAGSGRWANRGGKAKEWHTGFYIAKAEAKRTGSNEPLERYLRDNPKP